MSVKVQKSKSTLKDNGNYEIAVIGIKKLHNRQNSQIKQKARFSVIHKQNCKTVHSSLNPTFFQAK